MASTRSSLLKFSLALAFISFCFYFSYFFSWMMQLEDKLVDYRIARLSKPIHFDDIVIVDIDSSSMNKLNHWPWPRHYYADVVAQLNKYGASVIGIDVLFDSDSLQKQDDRYFSKILQQQSNVILSSQKFIEKNNNYTIETWITPVKLLSDYAPYGFINFPYEKNGSVRRAHPVLQFKKDDYKASLDLMLLSTHLNTPISEMLKHLDSHQLSIQRNPFRVLHNNSYYINFNSIGELKRVPFYLLLEDRVPDPSIFKDKIVLIGASLKAMNDFFITPKGILPGVDLHAHSIATLEQGHDFTVFNPAFNVMICVCITLFIGIFSSNASVKKGFLITITLLASYSAMVLISFYLNQVLVLWAPMLLLGAFMYFAIAIKRLFYEEAQKELIQSVFTQYVSPEVVNTLLKSPSAIKLGGEKKDVTVFFSDIRYFTAISESNDAEEVLQQLNEYLHAMTLCVFKWRGTLDKYIGDEMMCIWGAPIEQENHALLALQCAWEQLQILERLQKKWKADDKVVFDIGIGINSGPAIVGNVGSEMLKDYTVIGDNVNYAARLESLTRDFSKNGHICRLIISEETYERVKDYCSVKALGKVKVKGKVNASQAYEVVDVKVIKSDYQS